MCHARVSDKGESRDGGICADGDAATEFDRRDGRGAKSGDFGPSGKRAINIENIWRAEDLSILVIIPHTRTTIFAESAPSIENPAIEEQKRDAVIIPRDGHVVHGGEGQGGGVPYFGVVDGGGVVERSRDEFSSRDEDVAVGEDDAVVEGSSVVHPGEGLDVYEGGRITWDGITFDGEEVCVVGGHGGDTVLAVFIIRGTAHGEDFAGDGIVHDRVAVHGVAVGPSGACGDSAAGAGGGIEVHFLGRTGLEDGSILPGEQPAVVVSAEVLAVVGVGVVGQHGVDFAVI